jgi:hypothetical protein
LLRPSSESEPSLLASSFHFRPLCALRAEERRGEERRGEERRGEEREERARFLFIGVGEE